MKKKSIRHGSYCSYFELSSFSFPFLHLSFSVSVMQKSKSPNRPSAESKPGKYRSPTPPGNLLPLPTPSILISRSISPAVSSSFRSLQEPLSDPTRRATNRASSQSQGFVLSQPDMSNSQTQPEIAQSSSTGSHAYSYLPPPPALLSSFSHSKAYLSSSHLTSGHGRWTQSPSHDYHHASSSYSPGVVLQESKSALQPAHTSTYSSNSYESALQSSHSLPMSFVSPIGQSHSTHLSTHHQQKQQPQPPQSQQQQLHHHQQSEELSLHNIPGNADENKSVPNIKGERGTMQRKGKRSPTNYVWTPKENQDLMSWTRENLPQVWGKASVSHAHRIKYALYNDNALITPENIRHKINNLKAKYRKIKGRWADHTDRHEGKTSLFLLLSFFF